MCLEFTWRFRSVVGDGQAAAAWVTLEQMEHGAVAQQEIPYIDQWFSTGDNCALQGPLANVGRYFCLSQCVCGRCS